MQSIITAESLLAIHGKMVCNTIDGSTTPDLSSHSVMISSAAMSNEMSSRASVNSTKSIILLCCADHSALCELCCAIVDGRSVEAMISFYHARSFIRSKTGTVV